MRSLAANFGTVLPVSVSSAGACYTSRPRQMLELPSRRVERRPRSFTLRATRSYYKHGGSLQISLEMQTHVKERGWRGWGAKETCTAVAKTPHMLQSRYKQCGSHLVHTRRVHPVLSAVVCPQICTDVSSQDTKEAIKSQPIAHTALHMPHNRVSP